MVYGYYLAIASRFGAHSRVMGIASAFGTTPDMGWFFLSASNVLYLPSFSDQGVRLETGSAMKPPLQSLQISTDVHYS